MRQQSHSDDPEYLKEENRQLRELLDSLRRDRTICNSFMFRGAEATIYNALERYGKVSRENMEAILNRHSEYDRDKSEIRFFIARLRRKLPPGHAINTLRGWGWELYREQFAHSPCSSLSV